MHRDEERLLKLQKAMGVKFHAKDHHGDTVFVEIEGANAQQLLEYIQRGIQGVNQTGNIKLTKE
jgi:hypothetical protein